MTTFSRRLPSSLIYATLLALTWSASRALADEDPLEREPKRLALVIGNADYATFPDIPSSAIDAIKIAKALEDLDFQVTPAAYKDRSQLEEVLVDFRQKVSVGDLVVFYFSGHGFSHGPFNYLASTAIAQPVEEENLLDSAIALEELEDFFSCPPRSLGCRSPGLLVFITDACRTFTSVKVKTRDGDQVIAKSTPSTPVQPVNNVTNVLFAFASRPGSVASGTAAAGEPSIFTRHLVPVLGAEGMDLEDVIDEAGTAVLIETQTQNPGKGDWSKVKAFLRPTQQILNDQRTAWKSAVDTGRIEQVKHFLVRHAISRYAAAARKWLSEHPRGTSKGGYTLASPLAIERAWRGGSEEGVAVRRTQLPLGFPRVVEQEVSMKVRYLSDAEIGLVPSGTTAHDLKTAVGIDDDHLPFDAKATRAMGVAVALRDEKASLESLSVEGNQAQRTINISAGTELRVLSVEKESDNGFVVRAEAPGTAGPLRVAFSRSGPSEPLELGRSLQEVAVPPSERGFPDLANTTPLEEALAQLRQSGHTVTWVSIAAGKHRDTEDPEDLAARVAHIRYVLSRNGVDGRRVTAIVNIDDIPTGSVRVRLFGYNKGG